MYNDVVLVLIEYQTQKTAYYMIDHQYLNMLANSTIDDRKKDQLEYIHLVKHNKHKKTWVKYFPNKLVRLAQGVGERLKGATIIFSLAHEKL